jgi:hypothetical protein
VVLRVPSWIIKILESPNDSFSSFSVTHTSNFVSGETDEKVTDSVVRYVACQLHCHSRQHNWNGSPPKIECLL